MRKGDFGSGAAGGWLSSGTDLFSRRRRFDGRSTLPLCGAERPLIACATAECWLWAILMDASTWSSLAFACGLRIHGSEQKDQPLRKLTPRSSEP